MTPIEKIKAAINENKSFVLQGGAGSGKTETLKQVIEFFSESFPEKTIACITHTNLAANEIKERVGDKYEISTIHSFLNSFIKNYKKNIHQIIDQLFHVALVERQDLAFYLNDETEQKKKEHEKYKRIYKKYADALFRVTGNRAAPVTGKREYDQAPEEFNATLNQAIDSLNSQITQQIKEKDYDSVGYNETRFNSLRDLTYGHDGLLTISRLLFDRFPTLGKILADKYNCILVDEYQDTSQLVINILIVQYITPYPVMIGLFGDAMQAIYEDGIGDVSQYAQEGGLIDIPKEDNFRCSKQVVDFINLLRNDEIKQEVAFKTINDVTETLESRQGSAKLVYAIYEGQKPHTRSPEDEKAKYITILDNLITKAIGNETAYKQLKLTNKSIAGDAGFGTLFDIFNERYAEPLEEMEKHLARLQYKDLFELCEAYSPSTENFPNYNFVLSQLRKFQLPIKSVGDKERIKSDFETITQADTKAYQAIEFADQNSLLRISERHKTYLERKNSLEAELSSNTEYQQFKALYNGGHNTFARIQKQLSGIQEEDFDELSHKLKSERFYERMFSEELKFREIVSYYNYLNEHTPLITMHKTKGSGIDNVAVVLDEYFWSAYDFKSVFSKEVSERKVKTQKLVYVACSRAKKNLVCVRLLDCEEEEAAIVPYFKDHQKIDFAEIMT